MEQLSGDVLRILALKLPLKQIFVLCQTNKRFQQSICNSKPFWEALFLREIKEKVNIPPNTDISWYKEKIKIYPNVKKIADLIRGNKVIHYLIKPHKDKKSNDEKEFDNISSFEIIENLKRLYCENNQLTSLPSMPNLRTLYCDNNKLTSLPPMPNLEYLDCEDNQLTSLPSMPNLKHLYCNNNQLTYLPSMPNLEDLFCGGNPLPFSTLEEWINYCDPNS